MPSVDYDSDLFERLRALGPDGAYAALQIDLLTEALWNYGDRLRLATMGNPHLQQAVDEAFERRANRKIPLNLGGVTINMIERGDGSIGIVP